MVKSNQQKMLSRLLRGSFPCPNATTRRRQVREEFSLRLCVSALRHGKRSGGAFLSAAEFFEQARHVRADRVQCRCPAKCAGARAAYPLIERKRVGVGAQLL